ncbi:MAG: hypothetical protein IJX85_12100 [Lachnospiraceae bacterium]|nr:hypothetical protein [Lachnospiraceae bacterium]
MGKGKSYFERLISEDKYINELMEMYTKMMSIRRFKRKLEDIEKELLWYTGDEKNMFTPNYRGFYDHAKKNYIPKVDNTVVQPQYKELLGESGVNDIPDFVYCLVLYGFYVLEEKRFINEHKDDFFTLPRPIIREFNILHCKKKLLSGFLGKFDPLIAVFINAIDSREVEYLDDDISELDNRAIKHRFMDAVRMRDRSMAFKLLGRIRELDIGEDYYFEALAHYVNEEYTEAIRYADKVKSDNIDYASAVALKLECYSILGRLSDYVKCIDENKNLTFESWHIIYLLISMILNLDVSENDLDDLQSVGLDNIKVKADESPYYEGMTRRLIANILVEGFGILDAMQSYSQEVADFDISEEQKAHLMILQLALSIFPEEYGKYLDLDYISKHEYAAVKSEVEGKLLRLLIDYNSDRSFENLKAAFLMQLKLGNVDAFINNINSNFDALMKYLDMGESSVEEILQLAYIEGALRGDVSEKVKEYVEGNAHIDLSADIHDRKVIRLLTNEGKIAYEAAEWQFSKSNEEDYGWKDAGMISLGYFRILEGELNNQFVIPLLSHIGYQNIQNTFDAYVNTLTGNAKKDYKHKWTTIISKYKEMENSNFAGDLFMLGNLDHLFKAIGSNYDSNDLLAKLIRDNLDVVLTDEGMEEFNNGFFEGITNDDVRNKFRNPPAHTKYLSYSVACECRDFFQETVLRLGEIIKK